MFVIDEASAEAIRHVLNESGELAAAVELRRRFPGVSDLAQARSCVRAIAGWHPQDGPEPPETPRTPPRKA
jgi:hypothetical protein